MTMNKRFVLGMVIYALVFALIASAGLWLLWDFMEAYEASRPLNTIRSYVESVTPEDLCDGSEDLLKQLDSNLQTREEACQVIRQSVAQEFSYAKKSSESSEFRQVYVLRSGRQVIGSFTISAGEEDQYGLRVWELTEKSFDFSHLLGQSVSVTVPSDFTVSVNGNALDGSYITETDIPYQVLEEFSGEFPLPSMVTYSAEGFLGEASLTVADRNGNPVEITEETNYGLLLPECSDEEKVAMDELTEQFLKRYVAFTGGTSGSVSGDYSRLCRHLVPEGKLAKKLYTALEGLRYAQSVRDTIKSTAINQYARLGEGRYYCDVTYTVETVGKKGAVEMEYNMKIVMLETDVGLRVEAMSRY